MIIGVPKEIKNNEFRVGDDAGRRARVRRARPHGARREVRRRRFLVRRTPSTSAAGAETRRHRRRGLRPRRHDRQGQGAAGGRDRACCARARSSTPTCTSPPTTSRPWACSRLGRRGHRLRDRRASQPHAAAARADVRGRRPHGHAGRRRVPAQADGRPRHAHGRRPRRAARRTSSSSAPASSASTPRTSPCGMGAHTTRPRREPRPPALHRRPVGQPHPHGLLAARTTSRRPSTRPTSSSAPSCSPGARRPWLVTQDMLPNMKKGSVVVDVSVDQGGCIETTHPTTHADPTYVVDGVLHYGVANMPGAVPNTSTLALTNATLRYGLAIADKGWKQAVARRRGARQGRQRARRQGHLQAGRRGARPRLHVLGVAARLADRLRAWRWPIRSRRGRPQGRPLSLRRSP